MSTQVTKYQPYYILNDRLTYLVEDDYLIYYEPMSGKWVLTPEDDLGTILAELDNDGAPFPITNVDNNSPFEWDILDPSILACISLSGTCPTLIDVPNLCIRIGCEQYNMEYNYSSYNGRPYWVSQEDPSLSIRWKLPDNNWVFSGYSDTVISNINNTIPTSGWVKLGGLPKNVTVTQNLCSDNLNFTTTIASPSCSNKNNGSISFTLDCPEDGVSYQYSINGNSFFNTPVFSNVGSGNYTVCVKTNTTQNCKSVTVPSGPPATEYYVQLLKGNSQKTTYGNPLTQVDLYTPFSIKVMDSNMNTITTIPPGITLNVTFKVENQISVVDFDAPKIQNVYYLSNNGVPITSTQVNSPTATTKNTNISSISICDGFPTINCQSEIFDIKSYSVTNTYNFNVSGSYNVSGYVINRLDDIQPKLACDNGKVTDNTTINLESVTTTCNCCQSEIIGEKSFNWIGCDNNCYDDFPDADVETCLKYAEAVGLTESAPVP